jgi:ATP-dependent DNA helicase RecQ
MGRDAVRRLGQDPTNADALAETADLVREGAEQLGAAVANYLHEYGGREPQAEIGGAGIRSRPEFRAIAMAGRATMSALGKLSATLGTIGDQLREATAAKPLPGRLGALARKAQNRGWGARADIAERIDLLRSLCEPADPHLFVHLLGVDGEVDPEVDTPASRWIYTRIPIEVGDRFARDIVARAHATVMTSATLRVAGDFEFLGRRLGIEIGTDTPGAFEGMDVDSPFRHDEQSAIVLASHLPLPVPGGEQEFCEDLAADQVGFLSLTGGRTLTLFAARSRMERVAELVRQREMQLAERGVEIVVQGEGSTSRLVERFRENHGTVLYGLRSFWEGFDAPGETLSYLVLEKPPWPHPGDPVTSPMPAVTRSSTTPSPARRSSSPRGSAGSSGRRPTGA